MAFFFFGADDRMGVALRNSAGRTAASEKPEEEEEAASRWKEDCGWASCNFVLLWLLVALSVLDDGGGVLVIATAACSIGESTGCGNGPLTGANVGST